jgi:hypothetical protein
MTSEARSSGEDPQAQRPDGPLAEGRDCFSRAHARDQTRSKTGLGLRVAEEAPNPNEEMPQVRRGNRTRVDVETR